VVGIGILITSVLFLLTFLLLDQYIHGLIHCLTTHALVTDDALGVQDVDGRQGLDVVLLADRTVAAIEKRPPGNLVLLLALLEGLAARVEVDAPAEALRALFVPFASDRMEASRRILR
jgi:hypothetical protein